MVEDNDGSQGFPGGDENIDEFDYSGQGEVLSDGAPEVSAAKGKVFIVIAAILLFFAIIIYILTSSDDAPEIVDDGKRTINRGAIETTPDIPDIDIPPPPIITSAPIPPDLLNQSEVLPFAADRQALESERKKRLQSDMMVASGGKGIGGGASANPAPEKASPPIVGTDKNLSFSNAISFTDAPTVNAQKIRNLRSTIAQGRIVEAVLETPISTQLPGVIRAIVSRDTYAEAGRTRLIPKGSRLIGSYNTTLTGGQNRVFVIWTRVIRPDGVDIMINSPGTDQLGRAGVVGFKDNQYDELFSAAIMTSLITIAVAKGAEELLGGQDRSETTNTDGSTTRTGTSSADAIDEAVEVVSGTGKAIVARMIDILPEITIDQGTRVNVMINRDLVFPDYLSRRGFIN